MAQVEASRAEVRRWETVQSTYRQHLETLSLTLHPFDVEGSTAQTSTQVESRLRAAVAAIEAFGERHQLPTRAAAMKKVYKQLPALASLVDLWWAGVEQDIDQAGVSSLWRQWAREGLLPRVYWEYQVSHTRCTRRKAHMQQALEAVRAEFDAHALTQQLSPQALEDWKAWAIQQVKAFQRTSSAVEGRNGSLAGLHQNQRGLPKQRYKVWTALHNFDCRAPDGTTPASRFFRQTFPDLFETVLSHIDALPRPRQGNALAR